MFWGRTETWGFAGESRRKEITRRSRRRCEGGIVLTLNKQVVRACNGFIWLRVVERGGLV
jgi:hypothetical protein